MLAEACSVSLYAYAVMSNHLHVVLKLDAAAAGNWSDEEVARRWCRIFPGKGDPKTIELRVQDIVNSPELVSQRRDSLRDLGFFMGRLNDFIARRSNVEDDCTGRFWQGRYKSQLLLDERAMLAAMVYADLNPIRAKMATQLKSSDHTGIKRRITLLKGAPLLAKLALAPIAGVPQEGMSIQAKDYLALVDYSGRQWHHAKPGRIPAAVPPILQQMKLDARKWNQQLRGVGARRVITLGSVEALVDKAVELGRHWLIGIGLARMLAKPT